MMRSAIVALKNKRQDRGQHAGLLLQRYLCEDATGEDGNPEEKRRILHAAIAAATNEEVRALYKSAYDRWSAALPTEPLPVDLQTAGRLVIGLGSENVLETGIRLHHNYGMPIIPGSALKGLAAHYCDQMWGLADAKFRKPTKEEDEGYRKYMKGIGPKPEDNFHRLLFGTTDDSGCIVFHDAWYVPNSASKPLALDVMTPHHPKWLDGSVPPSDFDSPIPVPFLSVSGHFRIAVSWCGPPTEQVAYWTALALSLLQNALADGGVGGKTSSGYGRLVDPATVAGSPVIHTAEIQRNVPSTPKYIRGEAIQVTREEVKGKTKFRADDGFLGHFVPPESPPTDDTLTVWIANVNPQGYTFTMKQPAGKAKSSKQDRRGKRR